MVVLILVGWIAALLLVSGCDGEAAQATQESIVIAEQKKEAVMGMPCTWVAQCMRVELPCDVKQRKCVRAE